MKQVTVAKYLVSLFPKTGVDLIPLFQGGSIMKFIDEVGKNSKLKYICPHHEQALAMMVDGYARVRGFGIGMVTSGPGATNLLTGIACSYFDSIPCLFITGQVGRFHIKGERGVRQRGFQETDVVSMVGPITKFAARLDNPEDSRLIFEKSVYLAKNGRPGPVLIDIPYDVQRAYINPEKLKSFTPPISRLSEKRGLPQLIGKFLDYFSESKKPVVIVGGGVKLSGETKTALKFIKAIKIPAVTTWGGLGIIPSNYPLYLGNIGRNGHQSANEAIQRSDLILAFGCRFTPKEIISEGKFAQDAKVISVDIDKSELRDGLIDIDLKIEADLKDFLPRILEAFKNAKIIFSNKKWQLESKKLKSKSYSCDRAAHVQKKFVNPYNFIEILSESMSNDDIIVADTGLNLIWITEAFRIKAGQRFFSAFGHSPMGYAVAAAVGAYYGNQNKKAKVIATIGDGGMQMNIQELQVIALYKIPIKIFVFNNKCLGNLKFPVKESFNGRTYGTDKKGGYLPPDFIKVARAYGVNAVSLNADSNLKKEIRNILDFPGPVVADIDIDPEQYVIENQLS